MDITAETLDTERAELGHEEKDYDEDLNFVVLKKVVSMIIALLFFTIFVLELYFDYDSSPNCLNEVIWVIVALLGSLLGYCSVNLIAAFFAKDEPLKFEYLENIPEI